MTWNRDWTKPAKNIFEAFNIQHGDKFLILYNKAPHGKIYLIEALEALAKKNDITAKTMTLTLDDSFNITSIETELRQFFEGTISSQRKCFFTTSRVYFGPARRAVHKLISVDPSGLCGYTISLPTDDADIVYNLAETPPNELLANGERLKKILSQATKVHITSEKGTNISFLWNASRRKYLISAGFPDQHEDRWDNLGGEVFTAPIHETVNGRLVIDGAIANMGLFDGTVVVDITNGKGVINRKQSTASPKILDEFHKELTMCKGADIVGEFGVGTTPNLKFTGDLLNDEKIEGTIHIAFGDSYAADGSGGENDSDNHSDCMITSPTIDLTINGKTAPFMRSGKFLI